MQINSKNMSNKGKYSFRKGFDKVPGGIQPKVKAEIMEFLNIKTLAAWLARLNGKVEHKASEKEGIEKIFRNHKVTNIWGETINQS